jgi:hypothetical protein
MLTKTKIVLAAALMLSTASAALAGDAVPGSRAGIDPVHHSRSVRDHAGAKGAYALAPSATRNGTAAASRPRSGCTNVYNYDRALDGYSYDLVCNGVDLSPH